MRVRIAATSAVLKLLGFGWRPTLLHRAQTFAGGKAHQADSNGSNRRENPSRHTNEQQI